MPELPVRPFGNTGETCTTLGLGGGFPGFAGFDRSIETVRHAFALGIRSYDTSVMYRSGASQAIFGEALSVSRDRYFLSTKIGHFKEARHFRSVEAMHVQLRECLRLLRRESVDLLQIHEADWGNWWTDGVENGTRALFELERSYSFTSAPVVQFMREAKAQGLCRYIGITGNNARHLGRLIRELDDFDSVLVAYNYTPLNVTARDFVFPAAEKKGMAIIVAGLFTFLSSLPPGWRTEGTYFGQQADEQLKQLKALQHSCGITMAELAIRFVAADEQISSILVGACHPAEIEQNVDSLRRGKLPADLHAAMDRIARQMA